MKLWLIYQDVNGGYDVYDSAVVAADSKEDARGTLPSEYCSNAWAPTENVGVRYLGEAKDGHPAGVILASFNAG